MSPIPPNKELEKNSSSNELNQQELTNNIGNEETTDQTNPENAYLPIPQNIQNNENSTDDIDNDEDEDDDDEDDDDSEPEIDPDLHFEWLASSRASQKPNERNSSNDAMNNHTYVFETDVFERKTQLECEEIELDEGKAKTINNLMSNFTLPDCAIPEWAKVIPENVWKKNLIDSLNAKKTDLFELKSSQSSSE